MKKYSAILLAFVMLFSLSACKTTADADTTANADGSGTLNIVTTIFAEYDWVRAVLGDYQDRVSLTLLLDSGTDLHNYQPSAEDILKIANCDLFIYVGGESDEWVADALQTAANEDRVVMNLLTLLGDSAKVEETVEGMQTADEADEETEYDEHVWLSLKNAEVICSAIAEALTQLDSSSAAIYTANAEAYIDELNALDEQYRSAVQNAKTTTLLFADRFPFRYLADDYGLSYYAAFSGCSAETEASFETITFLAKKVDALQLSCILTIDGSDKEIAETLVQNTEERDLQILTLDSMQSVTAQDIDAGVTYLSVMEENLAVLKTALN